MALTNASTSQARPTFSIVSAIYNVARYLDEFIGSLEGQTYDLALLQVVAVDDGSTDDSLDRLRRWQKESDIDVIVVTKENGGQGSARNAGLEHAIGDWVTFTDPDDFLAEDYFERVADFLAANPGTDMVATHRVYLDDTDGRVRDSHPLRAMFRDGDVLRRLNTWGRWFAGSAPSSIFRRERLGDLRFDDRVQPNFEDGHFCCRYLLTSADPHVAFLRSAVYYYRRRSDGSSTLQTSQRDPRRFTDVLQFGYLDVLRTGAEQYGAAPAWLQNFVVYELSWYMSNAGHARRSAPEGPVSDEFHRLMPQILAYIDPEVIENFDSRPIRPLWRHMLLRGYEERPWRQSYAVVTAHDEVRNLVRISYFFTGPAPTEKVELRGRWATPLHAKIQDYSVNHRVLMQERIMWLPLRGTIHLEVDGVQLPIFEEEPAPGRLTLLPRHVRKAWKQVPPPALSGEQKRLLALAASAPVRRLFREAWVLMDRIHESDDSGEHLFRYLRQHRRDINAWFVVERGTPDWRRLKKDGYKRVVAHGSLTWKLLMLNARHLISSHIDENIVRPPELRFAGDVAKWRYTFLQHGVIKDDLSHWLNHKDISVFVTSTQDEFDSIVGDHTSYPFTTKEVVLTGLPRFDMLHEVGSQIPESERDLILLAPTWRTWLAAPIIEGTMRREEYGEDVLESEFMVNWLGLLRSDALRDAADKHGLKIGFLPHPVLQPLLPRLNLPDHVVPLSYEGQDVRRLFARSAVLVTDYSSVAFNAAYMERPVVYFQFDAERVEAGEHNGRRGYFSYVDDGFGPVAGTLEAAEEAIVASVNAGRTTQEPYLSRILDAFPQRDGGCCQRVTKAIIASTKPERIGSVVMAELEA